jgi:erythritol kinase
MAWLSIDAGTSVIKAVLISDTGRQVAVARSRVPVLRPQPTYAEQDMNQVWQAVVAASREVLLLNSEPLAGIVTTAQGDGVWMVDVHDEPVANAILWNDGRAAHSSYYSLVQVIEKTFSVSGSVPYAGLPSAILPWLRQHHPEFLERARWSMTCNGWLHLKLTGKAVADLSDASNPFCDLAKRSYSEPLLKLYGVNEQANLLPPIDFSFAPTNPLQKSAAVELGLESGLPVVMAPYDIVSTAVGAGSVRTGDGCLILGTTMCAEVFLDQRERNSENTRIAGTTLVLSTGRFLRAMPTLTGCEALDWVATQLCATDLNDLGRLADEAPAGSGNLVFLPYLSPVGERAPFLAAEARGSFLGLSLTHERRHLAKAVFEGLSFAARECLYAAAGKMPGRLTVCGGGARSDVWCQMLADVTGCEIVRTKAGEVGAQGAFYYAQVAMGIRSTLEQAVDTEPHGVTVFLPSGELQPLYNTLYERFLCLREIVAKTWQVMNGKPEQTATKERP